MKRRLETFTALVAFAALWSTVFACIYLLGYERGVAEGIEAAETLDTIVEPRLLGDTGSWLAGYAACETEERTR